MIRTEIAVGRRHSGDDQLRILLAQLRHELDINIRNLSRKALMVLVENLRLRVAFSKDEVEGFATLRHVVY